MDEVLNSVVPENPNKPYDMKQIIHSVVDDGDFFEVHEHYAENIIVGFARMDGKPVGVVANQPSVLAGVLDNDASMKGADSYDSATHSIFRFLCLRTCPDSCPAPPKNGVG